MVAGHFMRVLISALCLFVFIVAVPWRPLSAQAETPSVVDDFSDASHWKVLTSDGVHIKCSSERDDSTAADHPTTLRLDYDFASSGFAGLRLPLPLDLPPNFELTFSVRGD